MKTTFTKVVLTVTCLLGVAHAQSKNKVDNKERPNVLIIMFDQLRYDVFSHRNHAVVKTPNIDKLAEEGVVFRQATCSSPVCGPSRASMLSGCYAYDGKFTTRNREIEDETPFVFPIKTIDELLDANGYHVEYRGKWHCGNKHLDVYQAPKHIFGHNISKYADYLRGKGYKPKPVGNGYRRDTYTKWTYKTWDIDTMIGDGPRDPKYDISHSRQAGVIEVKDEDTLTAWTAKKTIDFLNHAPKNKPFAITCSILQPHGPVIASEKYAHMYKPANIPLPKNLYGSRVPRSGKKLAIPDRITEEGVKQFMALYYGLVKECDDQVGQILSTLKKNGLEKNTLVILTADHGEQLGSQTNFGKGEFFEESFRIPMIMRLPGKIKAGTLSDSVATGADIGPTILDYCNIKKLDYMHGRSLRNVINGAKDPIEYAYGQIRNEQCLRSTKWKLVVNKGEPYMFYDLVNDPFELKNLLKDKANMSEQARAKMKEMHDLLITRYKMVALRGKKAGAEKGKKKKEKGERGKGANGTRKKTIE